MKQLGNAVLNMGEMFKDFERNDVGKCEVNEREQAHEQNRARVKKDEANPEKQGREDLCERIRVEHPCDQRSASDGNEAQAETAYHEIRYHRSAVSDKIGLRGNEGQEEDFEGEHASRERTLMGAE
ncbi:MAG: hypothetical protein HBSIN02_16020 [Bacteroidia bacterium]|nr:MAG: hypothetical protein HBSIN02_16020 [Bacteroidia bacterium]